MPGGLWLVALGVGLAADGLAPVTVGVAAEGARQDLVVRAEGALVSSQEAALRLLLSDVATDAPVSEAGLSLRFFGPLGVDPIEVVAHRGELPGHYRATVTFPRPGQYAAAATISGKGAVDLLALSGLTVGSASAPDSSPSPPWLWLLGAALLCVGAVAWWRRGRTSIAAALLLVAGVAGDARAHAPVALPAAAVPGAEAYLAQEIQFFLGLRTEPVQVEAFEASATGGEATRQDLGVPRSAVVERDGHKLIFVRTAPEHFVAREAKLGRSSFASGRPRVAVLSGLALGERVVVEGAAFLRNGGAQPP